MQSPNVWQRNDHERLAHLVVEIYTCLPSRLVAIVTKIGPAAVLPPEYPPSPHPALHHAQPHDPRRQIRWPPEPLRVLEMRLSLREVLPLHSPPWHVPPGEIHRDPIQPLLQGGLRAELRGQSCEPAATLPGGTLRAPYPHHHAGKCSEVARPNQW